MFDRTLLRPVHSVRFNGLVFTQLASDLKTAVMAPNRSLCPHPHGSIPAQPPATAKLPVCPWNISCKGTAGT